MAVLLGLLGAALLLIARAMRGGRAYAARTPIAQAMHSAQQVVLQGRAYGAPASPSRIAGKLSVYWEAELWDTRWNRNRLPAIKDRSDSRILWIDDDTGRLPVLLHGVEWRYAGEDRFPAKNPAPAGAQEFAARHGFRWGSGNVRAVERRIEEGAPIRACGVVAQAEDVARILEGVQFNAVARMVAALEHMKKTGDGTVGEPFDLAAFVRSRFAPDERIVWCGRRPLIIGLPASDGSELWKRWMARGLSCVGTVLLVTAAAMFALAVAVW